MLYSISLTLPALRPTTEFISLPRWWRIVNTSRLQLWAYHNVRMRSSECVAAAGSARVQTIDVDPVLHESTGYARCCAQHQSSLNMSSINVGQNSKLSPTLPQGSQLGCALPPSGAWWAKTGVGCAWLSPPSSYRPRSNQVFVLLPVQRFSLRPLTWPP